MSDRPTPETREAWDAVSRTPDGMYDSQVPTSSFAIAMFNHSKKMELQRDEAREILAATLKALPVGYLPNHTPESIPERVADLVARYAEADRERDEYAKTLRVIAESNDGSHHETAYSAFIRERHPEIAGNAKPHTTGGT